MEFYLIKIHTSKYFLYLTYLGITTTHIQDGRIHWSCDKPTHLDVSIFSEGNVLNSIFKHWEFTSTKYARWPLNAYFCYELFWKRIRPMQWLTPIIGLFHNWATVLATTATDTKGAPIPGPAKLSISRMEPKILLYSGLKQLFY